MTEPQQMIPCTESVMQMMLNKVMEVMLKRGVIERGNDDAAPVDQFIGMLKSQGHIGVDGKMHMGQCLLLPRRDSGIALLLVSPCPTDEYDADLRRKPSPIKFERTERGEIILPARWLITKLEALAENPVAPSELQTLALQLSRRAHISDIVLPCEAETVALKVESADGTETITEALPGGLELSLDFQGQEG